MPEATRVTRKRSTIGTREYIFIRFDANGCRSEHHENRAENVSTSGGSDVLLKTQTNK